jgi:glutamine amidotransferase
VPQAGYTHKSLCQALAITGYYLTSKAQKPEERIMCRWLAYTGAPILLEEVLFKTDHSLIDQSLHAADGPSTNGDGFGIGWYGERDVPGIYKDIRPAWNDSNLQALAAQIESPLFLAHVRATTGPSVQRTNCHPFHHENWLFVHNGLVNEFDRLHRDIAIAVAPELFPLIRGNTDSELLFLLALGFGLTDDVHTAVARVAGLVEHTAARHGIDDALHMTLGISDGESLYAVRYSTAGDSRTLFYSANRDATGTIAPAAGQLSQGARAIVSEPWSDLEEEWVPVPEATFLTIRGRDIRCEPFVPIAL